VSTWKDLHNEGVRLAAAGDLPGARAALEAALATTPAEDRAQCLLNLAHVVDLSGDRQHAVDLMTEAIPVAEGPLRALVIASRADLLPWLGRWDEAWGDVEAALVDAEPPQQVALRNTRIALLMMAGRLAEAEEDATAAVELAARHAPEFLPNLYTNLAILADEAGDEQRAAMCRLLAENPGQQPLGPRWHRFVELNAEGAVLASSGDRAGAAAKFEAAYRETVTAADVEDDVEAMVCRAAVAGNLAGVAADRDEALRWSTEAATVARSVLAVVGDAYGTATVLVNALVSRAWQLNLLARLPEALADLDDAAEAVQDIQELEAPVRATRARVLATGGWYAEAAEEARLALELAYAVVPPLAATVHMTLAEIMSGTGDLPGAVEHLALARDLCAATGDVDGQAAATLSWARLAYLAADGDRADALYDEAERLLTDDPRRLAACVLGRAAVAVLRGRPREALESLDRARTSLGAAATTPELVAMHQVRGSAYESLAEFAAADSCYGEASALCEAAGLWHVVLGMAWWRADALVRRAAAATGDERRTFAVRALDLALPAALAADAVRQRFPHGPLRERWVALASAPATRAAFWAIGSMEDPALAAEYIDHIAGAVSLHAEGVTPVERGELVSLPEPPVTEPHLPYAASGFTAGADPAFPAAGFELPPRVRLDPAVPSRLDTWIDVAEERYGFPVRSALAVASW
jgi:tetratricopeptide (TPR) repeat protein